jgi:hypothetical protein
MGALTRFFPDVTWTGAIEPGGMGPGTPAMTGRGSGRSHLIQDGLWIVGDYRQDQFLPDGTYVLTWHLHWVTGWDADAGEYVATHSDNYGHCGILHGRIAGDQLIYESSDGPARLRMTFDASDPQCRLWTNEISAAGGPWRLIESYRMTPTSSEAEPAET